MTMFKLISGGNTNLTQIKPTAGTIYDIEAWTVNAGVRFLKLYDSLAQPTVGQTKPAAVYAIPGSAAGGRFGKSFVRGLAFANGIWMALTVNPGDGDSAAVGANDHGVNIDFS